jgi:GPH family glycoside/pentoside/hexuronide:cation symporter
VQLARRFGKRRPLVVGACVLGVGTALLYWLAPGVERRFELVLWVGAVGLGGFVGSVVLIDAMLTDVLDHDCVRTRQLRSGLFFGVWRFAGKVARALAVAFAGLALDAAGFVEGAADQPPSVATALTWMFGPGVGAAFVLTACVLWRYRFDERKQAQARAILARRAAGRRAVTPASAR